jgi:hypothetical protein
MIKFFRKIRQNLLSEEKTGKYFKYAIGEIVLVVIGILIALQINNWNTNKIDRNEELTMLKEMTVALKGDISSIEGQLKYLDNINRSVVKLVMNQKESSYPNDSLKYHFNIARRGGIGLSINSSPYESLKSSGLNKISNSKLRNSITNLYEIQLKGIDFWINDFILKQLDKKNDLVNEIFTKKITTDSISEVKIEYLINHDLLYNNPKSSEFLALSSSYIPMAKKYLKRAISAMKIQIEEIENELHK